MTLTGMASNSVADLGAVRVPVRTHPVREREERLLASALDDLAVGRSGATVVSGDPGLGKSYLLSALGDEAERRGLVVLRGSAQEGGQGIRFHAFIEAFAGWHRGSGMVPPEAVGRLLRLMAVERRPDQGPGSADAKYSARCRFFAQLRRAIAECVAEVGSGLLLLLDDFHQADPESVELVEALVKYPLDAALSVIIAHRPRQSSPQLHSLLDHGRELGLLERVALAPLTVAQFAALLGPSFGPEQIEELHRRSEGIPLYLAALAGDTQTLPARGRAGAAEFGARLRGEATVLRSSERLVVRSAAVLDDPFDAGAVAEVAQISRAQACDALNLLQRHDFVRSVEGGMAFRHPLLRKYFYDDADTCWQERAHRRALSYLGTRGRSLREQARQVQGLGNELKAADVAILLSASREALYEGDPVQAGRWVLSSLRSIERMSEPQLACQEWVPVVRALAQRGEGELIRQIRSVVLAGAPEGEAEERARIACYFATMETLLGHPEEAKLLIAGELSRARDRQLRTTGVLSVHSGMVRVLAGELLTDRQLDALTQEAEIVADRRVMVGALAVRGFSEAFSRNSGRQAGATLAAAEKMLHRLTEQGVQIQAEYVALLGWGEAVVGGYPAAAGHLERAVTAVRSGGDVHLLPVLLNPLAFAQYHLGALAEARTTAVESRTLARHAHGAGQLALASCLASVIGALMCYPDPAPGRPSDGSGDQSVSSGSCWWTPLVALLTAEAARNRGDCRHGPEQLISGAGGPGLPDLPQGLTARAFELIAAGSGDTEHLQEWADCAASAAGVTGFPAERAYAQLALGHALASGHHSTEAFHCYESASTLFQNSGQVCDQVRSLLYAASQATGSTLPTQSWRLYEQARRTARRIGAAALCEKAQQYGEVLPAHPTASAVTATLSPLTHREREVAFLAGQGLRTRDIAERLRISPRTVDVHLTRIYSKLEVRSRAGLAHLLGGVERRLPAGQLAAGS